MYLAARRRHPDLAALVNDTLILDAAEALIKVRVASALLECSELFRTGLKALDPDDVNPVLQDAFGPAALQESLTDALAIARKKVTL